MKDNDSFDSLLYDLNKQQKSYSELDRKYVQLYEEYKDSFEKFSDEMRSKEHGHEYSKGSMGLHRGYYSPSIQDLYVGGKKPGRLLKRPPKNNNYDMEYIFDENGNMICCKTYWIKGPGEFLEYTNEFFIYGTDKVSTFVFALTGVSSPELIRMTECLYKDGLLVRFEKVLCSLAGIDKECSEISIEEFEYEGGLLKSSIWHDYMPGNKHLRKMKHTFFRNEAGEIECYSPEYIDTCSFKAPKWDPLPVYKVKSKRRLIK